MRIFQYFGGFIPQHTRGAPHPATALPERILVALVPLHELGDAAMQAPVGLVTTFGLKFRGVGVRLVNVARLHRHLAADVVYFVGHVVRALFCDRHVVKRMHTTLGDVVDVGEVANHVAVVEHLDGFALRDGAGKEHRAHVGLNFLLFLLAAYKLTGLSTLSSSL